MAIETTVQDHMIQITGYVTTDAYEPLRHPWRKSLVTGLCCPSTRRVSPTARASPC